MQEIPIEQLKGVGPARAEAFAQMGIRTVSELLDFLPRAYLDYTAETSVAALEHGKTAAVRVRLQSDPKIFRRGKLSVVSVRADDGTAALTLKWYNQPYRRAQMHAGETVFACGRADLSHGKALQNPQISDALPGLVPVYPVCRGLTQRTVRDAMRAAIDRMDGRVVDPLPTPMREAYGLCALEEAWRSAHLPQDAAELDRAQKRLAFSRMLYYLLAVEQQKADRRMRRGYAFDTDGIRERFLKKLPYAPTGAQLRVMAELEQDMGSPVPMNRLLQGDVGSGKTVLACYALCIAAANGCQGALLAPTEILAKQHYETLYPVFGDALCLLTGGMERAARERALDRLSNGTALVAVGTHALLTGDVQFQKLGVVVTDEQHRFGVSQRAAIVQKGVRPDVLVMSATPIPRTLAMLLYGDLDVSVLDELPPGRKPVKTRYILPEKREDMYAYIAAEAGKGVQSYIVCPFIEPSETVEGVSAEELFAELKERFAPLGVQVGLLHGQLAPKAKQQAMDRFYAGKTQVLVTTTVIEVGVHVPNASIMAVEGAERFGMAQLHQLRGRVGRGDRQAYCFLLTSGGGEAAEQRIRALTETSDGFEIAERDLLQRGPGDFLGTRQHGEGDASLLYAAGNMELLKSVKRAAQDVMDLPSAQHNDLIAAAMAQYAAAFDRIAMN